MMDDEQRQCDNGEQLHFTAHGPTAHARMSAAIPSVRTAAKAFAISSFPLVAGLLATEGRW